MIPNACVYVHVEMRVQQCGNETLNIKIWMWQNVMIIPVLYLKHEARHFPRDVVLTWDV